MHTVCCVNCSANQVSIYIVPIVIAACWPSRKWVSSMFLIKSLINRGAELMLRLSVESAGRSPENAPNSIFLQNPCQTR